LDIAGSGELREIFSRSVQEQAGIIIDLSAVESCDLAGLQLLCAARKTAVQSGKSFRVIQPSAAVLETASALGLAPGEFGYAI
jgi:anti-anti-sigma factor